MEKALWKRNIEPYIYQQKDELKNDTLFRHLVTVFPLTSALGAYFISKLQRCDAQWRAKFNQGKSLFQSKMIFPFDFSVFYHYLLSKHR